MPVAEESVKSSWADEVEEVEVTGGNSSTEFPHPIVKNDGNSKTITEVVLNEDDKKVKVISHYKIEKHRVAKSIAQRKTWKKFGLSENDKPGPNPATTIGAEEVQMQFLSSKDEDPSESDDLKKKLIDSQKGQVKCRLCKEDHWTKQCPYKDKLEPLRSSLMDDEKDEEPAAAAPQEKKTGIPGKYVPPSMREGGSKKGESMISNRRDETATVRVTNLSENTREQDLQELFRPFGEISRIFLAKDKFTMASKGFAFINYKRRDDAARAIQVINGFGYDHLILNVEWANLNI
ncbi:Eukaryotic translation initiation factor 3 subunit G [Armadillidium nasatum]|uniref:Eukaryotic translation initiation factor 3 subunit G n=1 Tax=Armadillidium nasatum TaxID=96803 RepID=A0A5N5SNM1_9CRUS|nr:Eukaryotic translation initiation factor 3 subunit G [Armadillidium nasatum]